MMTEMSQRSKPETPRNCNCGVQRRGLRLECRKCSHKRHKEYDHDEDERHKENEDEYQEENECEDEEHLQTTITSTLTMIA